MLTGYEKLCGQYDHACMSNAPYNASTICLILFKRVHKQWQVPPPQQLVAGMHLMLSQPSWFYEFS